MDVQTRQQTSQQTIKQNFERQRKSEKIDRPSEDSKTLSETKINMDSEWTMERVGQTLMKMGDNIEKNRNEITNAVKEIKEEISARFNVLDVKITEVHNKNVEIEKSVEFNCVKHRSVKNRGSKNKGPDQRRSANVK
ncbi:hypothetical protein SNE40_001232 [Patella caerulea]